MRADVKIFQFIDFGHLSCKILWSKMDILVHGKMMPVML